MTPKSRDDAGGPPGIIETLSAGFQVINRIPWIIGLPVSMHLVLWLGPRLSVAVLLRRVVDGLARTSAQMVQGAGPAAEAQLGQLQEQLQRMHEIAGALNLVSLLAMGGFAMNGWVPPAQGRLAGTIEIAAASTVVALSVLFFLTGLAVACLWLGAIAAQVRDGRVDPGRLIRAVPRYWLALIGFLGLAIGLLFALALPLSIAAGIVQLFAPGVGALLALLGVFVVQLVLLWALLYLFFLTDAIVVSEVGPIRGALNSVRVVSASFWSTLGFIIITWVIMGGMGVIWDSLASAPVGVVAAILGNGYIVSGLAAASMLFYRNRVVLLPVARRGPAATI